MIVRCYLRDHRHEPLRAIATRAGISAGILAQIENGRALPRDTRIRGLEDAYNLPLHQWYPDYLLPHLEHDPETAHNQGGAHGHRNR
jgi:transcriptional regulator with XRE-family HTH domain